MTHPEKTDIDLRERSPLALAFLGDGVWELLVRGRMVARTRKSPGALQRQVVALVSAQGQQAALLLLEPFLTPSESAVVRRGRNSNKNSVAKHASPGDYRASTGLEALFGWLYLQDEQQRMVELFELVWQGMSPQDD